MVPYNLQKLQRFAFFEAFERTELDQVTAMSREWNVGTDTTIFNQEDVSDHFYFLLSGHVRVNKLADNGNEVILHYLAAGDIFGIDHILAGDAYPASATSVVDCSILVWPISRFIELCTSCPPFCLQTLQAVSQSLLAAQDHSMKLATAQVDQRIAGTLLRILQRAGRKSARGMEIDFPITRREIAQMGATTLHTVSRTLSKWQTLGILQSTRKSIVITDPHKLQQISQSRTT